MTKTGVSYQETITVSKQHLDGLNHVNNVIYIQWLNDISEKHWKKITSPQLTQASVWIVLKHEIKYIKQAVLGDVLTVKTHIGETFAATSIRYVTFLKNNTPVAIAQSTWCLIDKINLKPKRIGQDILDVLYSK